MDQAIGSAATWLYVRAWAGFLLGGVAAAVSMKANSAMIASGCEAPGLPFGAALLLLLLPALGGLISYQYLRSRPDMNWLHVIARVGTDFCVFIAALILMHMGYVAFLLKCPM